MSSFLQFESLRAFGNIRHFTTTRYGGCSTGAFASFNLGNYSGDAKDHINANRKTLCDMLGLPPAKLLVPHQTHGLEIAVIGQEFLETPEEHQKAMLEGKDAMLTQCKNVCIAISTADCVPILLYATDRQAVAAVHAGWRGTCGRIVQAVVRLMICEYGCDPLMMHAAIGPSIGPDAFEVGDEVYHAFHGSGFEMNTIASRHPASGKYHINLWEANLQQLTAAGIPSQQVEVSGMCTYQHSETFFSARKLGTESGRMLTGIWMTE